MASMQRPNDRALAISRRSLLKAGAMGTIGAAMAGQVAGASDALPMVFSDPAGERPDPSKAIGTDLIPKIKHIVVVMMENQSFDSVLGTLTAQGQSTPRGNGLSWSSPGSRPSNSNPTGVDGEYLQSFNMPSTCQLDSLPWQTWDASWTQFLGSPTYASPTPPSNPSDLNQGFVISQSGPVSMGYFDTASQLSFTNSLAQTFPIADNWHCSVPAQTYPNRRYLMAGTSLGLITTSLSVTETLPKNGTIFLALMKYGISWKNYYCNAPSSLIWLKQAATPGFMNHLTPISNFFKDCAAGTLPAVSLVDPNYNSSSGENPQDLQHADAFLHDVMNAVLNGKGWKDTLVLWTFDEHGGYYDHVPLAQVPVPDDVAPINPDWGGNPSFDTFGWTGFRVPTGVVSPYAKADYVSEQLYDHTSFLKLVEEKWNLPPFTPRDAAANSPLDMVDLDAPPTFLKPPPLAPAPVDRKNKRVSTGIGADMALTADEKEYPDSGVFVPGKGHLRRQQYYTNKAGASTGTVTPFYELMQDAWATPPP